MIFNQNPLFKWPLGADCSHFVFYIFLDIDYCSFLKFFCLRLNLQHLGRIDYRIMFGPQSLFVISRKRMCFANFPSFKLVILLKQNLNTVHPAHIWYIRTCSACLLWFLSQRISGESIITCHDEVGINSKDYKKMIQLKMRWMYF